MEQKIIATTNVKQKVIIGVAIAAIIVGGLGILSAIGRSQGYGFGYPFVKKTSPKISSTKIQSAAVKSAPISPESITECPTGCQSPNSMPKADGTYDLGIGERAYATNGIGLKVVDIIKLDAAQQAHFGAGVTWVLIDFYVGDRKLTPMPIRFKSSSYLSVVTSHAIRLSYIVIYKNNQEALQVKIESVEAGPIESCQDLVELCQNNGFSLGYCQAYYCVLDPGVGEIRYQKNRFGLIVPKDFQDIGNLIMNQIEKCYNQDFAFLPISPLTSQTIVHLYYDDPGALKTLDNGQINWPIGKDINATEVKILRESFINASADKCAENVLAHEIFHNMSSGISMDDIYKEGITTFVAQNVAPQDSYKVTCFDNSWRGESPENHASPTQRNCFSSCLNDCYQSVENFFLFKDQSHKLVDGTSLKLQQATALEGNYHGYANVSIISGRKTLDQKTLYTGDLYSNQNRVFIIDNIETEDFWDANNSYQQKIGAWFHVFNNKKTNPPAYCSDNCTSVCQMRFGADQSRVGADQLHYYDFSKYLQVPWGATYKMFYNSSQCFFNRVDRLSHERLIKAFQVGAQKRQLSQEFCFDQEIKKLIGPLNFEKIKASFGIGDMCKWEIPTVGNGLDCWKYSGC